MIVGSGPYLETLRKKAVELGVTESVIFTGMVSPVEVASYYPAGDLFVSASTSETQGLTYAEALAAGLPLLCRRDECLRAVVEEGKNGWVCDALDSEGYQQAISLWLKGREQGVDYSAAARATAEPFTLDRMAKELQALYRDLLR